MALYFYFNETTGDLVYSDKATYGGSGYTSLGEQTNVNPGSRYDWVFNSQRSAIVTVSKDKSVVGKIAGLKSMCYMFRACSNLTSLDLSGFDASTVTNMRSMFDGCGSLTSLDLSDFYTPAVTEMHSMFAVCNSLASLDLSGLDTSAVTDMGSMFGGCINLISLDLSGFDASTVTDMSHMFDGCNNLANLDLSGFDTSAVTDMSYMFSNCKNLANLDLSGFDTSAVTDMSAMFDSCTDLTSLDLSGFDTSAVTDMGSMFSGCTSLRLITISDKMSNALSQLPADQYYPAAGGSPVAKADLTAGTWVRDEADLTKVTSLVQQAQMSQAISRRIGDLRRDLEAQIREASALLDQLDFAAGGLIPVENGGTGATTAAQARTNLGAASASDLQSVQDSLSQLSNRMASGRLSFSWEYGSGATGLRIKIDGNNVAFIGAGASVTGN